VHTVFLLLLAARLRHWAPVLLGLYSAAVSYFKIFLTISVTQISSTSTGPIFAKFS